MHGMNVFRSCSLEIYSMLARINDAAVSTVAATFVRNVSCHKIL